MRYKTVAPSSTRTVSFVIGCPNTTSSVGLPWVKAARKILDGEQPRQRGALLEQLAQIILERVSVSFAIESSMLKLTSYSHSTPSSSSSFSSLHPPSTEPCAACEQALFGIRDTPSYSPHSWSTIVLPAFFTAVFDAAAFQRSHHIMTPNISGEDPSGCPVPCACD